MMHIFDLFASSRETKTLLLSGFIRSLALLGKLRGEVQLEGHRMAMINWWGLDAGSGLEIHNAMRHAGQVSGRQWRISRPIEQGRFESCNERSHLQHSEIE